MGETLSLFEPSINGSVRVEKRSERLSGDAGFLLLREVLDDTGGFYPVSTDGLETPENFRSCLATLRRMRGLWNRSM